MLVEGKVPVSYTHLDVYKRQLLNQITGRYGSLILSLPAEIQTGSDIYADAPE